MPLPTKRDARRIWPRFVRMIPLVASDAPGPYAAPAEVTRRDPPAPAGIAPPNLAGCRRPGVVGPGAVARRGRHTHATNGPRVEETASTYPRPAPRTSRDDDDTLDDPRTGPRDPLALHHFHDPPTFPCARPDCPPVPDCLPILMLGTRPLAAAPPPALQLHAWAALPTPVVWQVEEGGSSASAVDPPSSKAQA